MLSESANQIKTWLCVTDIKLWQTERTLVLRRRCQ